MCVGAVHWSSRHCLFSQLDHANLGNLGVLGSSLAPGSFGPFSLITGLLQPLHLRSPDHISAEPRAGPCHLLPSPCIACHYVSLNRLKLHLLVSPPAEGTPLYGDQVSEMKCLTWPLLCLRKGEKNLDNSFPAHNRIWSLGKYLNSQPKQQKKSQFL